MAFYLLVDLQLAEKAQYRAYTQAHTAGERTSFSWRRFYNDARHRQIYFDNGRVRKRCEDSPHSKSTFVRNCERSISFREALGVRRVFASLPLPWELGLVVTRPPRATLKSRISSLRFALRAKRRLERVTRLEIATSTLARWCSTNSATPAFV